MRLNKKYFWNILLIITVTVIAMYFALRDNFSQIMAAIARMNVLSLLFVLAWGLAINVAIGLGYQILTLHYKKGYTLWQGVVVAFTGTFFAGITPSSTGGQFGQIYVLKKQGLSYSDGASLLWADFIIYQTVMMIYVTILFALRYSHYANLNAWFWIVFAGYLVNVVVILGLYTMALFPKVYIWLSGKVPPILAKIHLCKDPEHQSQAWIEQVTGFTTQIRDLSHNKMIVLKTAGANVLRLTMYYALPYIVAVSLGIRLPISSLIDCMALASFVTMANSFVPLPGASGGTEVFFTMLFSSMLGPLTGAVLLLWRFSSYYIPVIAGALVFMVFKNRQSAKEDREKIAHAVSQTEKEETKADELQATVQADQSAAKSIGTSAAGQTQIEEHADVQIMVSSADDPTDPISPGAPADSL